MTTISEFHDKLPDLINETFKNHLLNKLDANLKQELDDCGGNIKIDMENRTYQIIGCNLELEEKIKQDLESKK